MQMMQRYLIAFSIILFCWAGSFAQVSSEKANAIVARAVQNLGGDRYLQVRSQVGRGKFSAIREGAVVSFQSFVDVIVFPDRERSEFKGGGSRTIQVNTG